MTTVLVVEDNVDFAFGLQTALETEGYAVQVAHDGRAGLERARGCQPDLILLDLMLPQLDGYRVLREVRRSGLVKPVLILTARSEEADKVLGLDWGADDYVTKPFGMMELLARVRALLRRGLVDEASVDNHGSLERFGEVEVDTATLRRRGALATRLEFLKEVWGYEAEVMTRTVDVHIAELRRKLEWHPSKPEHILTVRKVGYRLQA